MGSLQGPPLSARLLVGRVTGMPTAKWGSLKTTHRITCRLEPPTGVLRQPEMSSNLISARCTLFAPGVLLKGLVLLYIVPILGVASLCTSRSFLRFVSDIKVTRRWVSSLECQLTPEGSFSIIEDRLG